MRSLERRDERDLPSPSGTGCSNIRVSTPTQRRKKAPLELQRPCVDIDLHRRRSVIVRRSAVGETLETTHIDNDPVELAAQLANAW